MPGGAAARHRAARPCIAELNSRVKLSDLIQGVIVQSANDAWIAIAEAHGRKRAGICREDDEARPRTGLKNAEFRNATGLPDPEHVMSVRDLATLARYININFPEHYKYYSQPEFTWNKITQQNRNPLLEGLSRRRRHEDRLYQGGRVRAGRLGHPRRPPPDHGDHRSQER